MKKIILTLSFIVAYTSIAFSQNKYNLNFDDFNPDEQERPTGWFIWGFYKTVTGEKVSDGNSVGKVVANKDGRFGCITYRIPANYVGDSIKLSGRIKYENVKDYVGLLMRIDGAAKSGMLQFKSMQNLNIRGTNDWKEYSIALPLPANAENIYVGGILGKKGVAWFDDFKVSIDGKDIQTLEETKKLKLKDYDAKKLTSALSKSSMQIELKNKESVDNNLDALIKKIGDKRIVAIGESTHGTSEFYQLREAITKRLVAEKGFNLVVLENPYDDIEILNRDLYTKPLDSLIRNHLFSIYQTEEIKSFLQWYKENRSYYTMEFKGCDDSLWVLHELLREHINSIDDKKLNALFKNLETTLSKNSTNNFKKELKINSSIYNKILAIENHLKETKNLTKPIEEILFNGKKTYINYVNIKNKKALETRDETMADRISFLAKNPNSKIIIWAHNAHISNKIITDNEIGLMGRDLKKAFGKAYYTIGFTTLNGSYSYMDEKFINGDHDYTEKLKKESIKPSEDFFWENAMATNGNEFIIDMEIFKNELKTDEIIGPTKLIGYAKESEEDIYYIQILQNFDSLIFIKETQSTTSIFK